MIGVEIDPAVDRERLGPVPHHADRPRLEARVAFQMHEDAIARIEPDPAIGAGREVMRFAPLRIEREAASCSRS